MAVFRGIIRGIDSLLRRLGGIIEFADSPDCMIRIASDRARCELLLGDGTRLRRGDRIIEIHLWNDNLHPIPLRGPDMRWATATRRQFDRSLRMLASHLRENPGFSAAEALVIRPALAGRQLERNLNRIVAKLGFEPHRGIHSAPGNPVHRLLDNLWLWLLTWTFNPASLARRPFRQIRQEFWISRRRFTAMYGESPPRPRAPVRAATGAYPGPA